MIPTKYITVSEVADLEDIYKQTQIIADLVGAGWIIVSSVATSNTVHYVLRKD